MNIGPVTLPMVPSWFIAFKILCSLFSDDVLLHLLPLRVLVNALFNFWHQNSVYKAPRFSIVSQGFTEDQDKEKDKDSQDHWWRVEFPEMVVWPSGEEDERREKEEEKTTVSSSKALFRFSSL